MKYQINYISRFSLKVGKYFDEQHVILAMAWLFTTTIMLLYVFNIKNLVLLFFVSMLPAIVFLGVMSILPSYIKDNVSLGVIGYYVNRSLYTPIVNVPSIITPLLSHNNYYVSLSKVSYNHNYSKLSDLTINHNISDHIMYVINDSYMSNLNNNLSYNNSEYTVL